VTETAHAGDKRHDDEGRLLDELLAELRGILTSVEQGVADANGRRWSLTAGQLLTKARQRTRDKEPAPDRTRSSAGLGYTNPTQGAGLEYSDPDPDLKAWRSLHTHLTDMHAAGSAAIVTLADATPPQAHPDRVEFGCRICSRPNHPEPAQRAVPIFRAERCHWCYDFWLRWSANGVSVEVPLSILKLRWQDKTVTERDVRRALDEVLTG
jgi:hypothetical protein